MFEFMKPKKITETSKKVKRYSKNSNEEREKGKAWDRTIEIHSKGIITLWNNAITGKIDKTLLGITTTITRSSSYSSVNATKSYNSVYKV